MSGMVEHKSYGEATIRLVGDKLILRGDGGVLLRRSPPAEAAAILQICHRLMERTTTDSCLAIPETRITIGITVVDSEKPWQKNGTVHITCYQGKTRHWAIYHKSQLDDLRNRLRTMLGRKRFDELAAAYRWEPRNPVRYADGVRSDQIFDPDTSYTCEQPVPFYDVPRKPARTRKRKS